jgi:hypothetical protein
MIEDALAAKTDVSRPALGGKESERDELHRLAALWVSKCGQPQPIVDDAELSTLLARILELRKAKLRYQLPSRNTLATHLTMNTRLLNFISVCLVHKTGNIVTQTQDFFNDKLYGYTIKPHQ